MTISYGKFDLKEVINASGRMTILGVSKVFENVLAAQRFGGKHFLEMNDLAVGTGAHLSQLLKVEDAQIVSSASAGIAQSIAVLIGQSDMYYIYHPYTEKIARREIIILKGHDVDYGTPVEVVAAQGGGKVIEAGCTNMCTPEHISVMITERTTVLLYVKSHHAVRKGMLTIAEMVEVAEAHRSSLIVDAAAGEDLFKYSEMDVDLVICSGARAIKGPSAGLVVGKKKYIQWIQLRSKSTGRAMKIGKDNILGFTQALEDYLKNGSESGDSMKQRLAPFVNTINQLPDLSAEIVRDGAGRDIYRASVTIDDGKGTKEVIQELKARNPAVYTREHQANNEIIEFDIHSVSQNKMEKIIKRLGEIMQEAPKLSVIPNYYKNRVYLDVLAHSVENARACYEATEGHIILGVLSKNYTSDEAATGDMKRHQDTTNNTLSVGLSAGDPDQNQTISRLSGALQPQHVSQAFTGVGASRVLLGQGDTVINGLASLTGKIGYISIATGPLSLQAPAAEVPIEAAIQMLQDMGGTSIKYFPMKGLTHREEFKAVTGACTRYEFYLESAEGINPSNFEEILRVAIDAGVKEVIPHVYSSIMDKEAEDTRIGDVKILLSMVKKIIH